jgi:hypothetical protein
MGLLVSLETSFCSSWDIRTGSLYLHFTLDINLWFGHIKSDPLAPGHFGMHDITSERFERNLEIPFSNMEIKTWALAVLALLDMAWRHPERYVIYTIYLSNRLLISAISHQACRISKPIYCGSGECKKGPFCRVRLSHP